MSEIRQRWRLVVSRGPAARDATHREVIEAWEAALETSGLPIARSEGERPRAKIAFGAPVPTGVTAAREPVEISLTERCSIAAVRSAIERTLPAGYTLVDLFDVWTGAPAIGGQVIASDYALTVPGTPVDVLRAAAKEILGAGQIVRERVRGDRVRSQDLRPLIAALSVGEDAGSATLGMRLRHDPERGVGRPDEVLAAIEEAAGKPIVATGIARVRLWLAEDASAGGLPALAPPDGEPAGGRQEPSAGVVQTGSGTPRRI